MQIPPPPPPPPPPADNPRQPGEGAAPGSEAPGTAPGPHRRPYGSVRLAAPVAALPPRGPGPLPVCPWQPDRVRLPPLSIGALRAARRWNR